MIIRSLFLGLRRLIGMKRYILLLYLINLALVLVFGNMVMEEIRSDLGKSTVAENLLEGFDGGWYDHFRVNASPIAQSFSPGVVGIGAVFEGFDNFLRGRLFQQAGWLTWLGIVYLLLWTFFSSGFFAKLQKTTAVESFFREAARFFPRFLGLAIMAGILYYLIFHFLFHPLTNLIRSWTYETVDERVAFALTAGKYLVVWFLMILVNLWFDYARIVTVIGDIKNVLKAPWRALRFVLRQKGNVLGIYFSLMILSAVLMFLYWAVVPEVSDSTAAAILMTFVLGQIYIVARMTMRVYFYASQIALYERVMELEAATKNR